jgi:hypothetical protein
MTKYVVQRAFPDGLRVPVGNGGAVLCRRVVERNALEGATWISSVASEDHRRTASMRLRARRLAVARPPEATCR